VVVVADAGHDEILAGRRFLRGLGALAAVLRDPLLGLGGGAVVDRDVMPALLLEVTGHRETHPAEPAKCDLRHPDLLRASRPPRQNRPRSLRRRTGFVNPAVPRR